MATAIASNIQLAQTLHPRLLRLFTRFPPPQLLATSNAAPLGSSTSTPSTIPSTVEIASTTSSSDPNVTVSTTVPTTAPVSSWPDNSGAKKHNPFLPFRNPRTGNWHPPHYSLRRQAELFKLAQDHNVMPLMPMSPKHPEVRQQKAIDRAFRAAKTGLLPISGKKAKGKLWERTLRGRMEERRKAMEGMPEMIRTWKERGHGRGWKKWPK